MKTVLSFSSQIDLFRKPLVLSFNSEAKNSNLFGVLCSLAIYSYMLVLFFQSDLVLRQNPLVLSQTVSTAHAEPIIFDQGHMLTLGVVNSLETPFINDTLFRLEFKNYHLKEINGAIQVISLEYSTVRPCLPEDSSNALDFDMAAVVFDNSYCLVNKNFRLEGGFDESEIYYSVANLYMCDNVTSNGTCQSQETIDSFFLNNKMFFAANFYSASVDLRNYLEPIQTQYITQIDLIDTTLTKRLYVYMKPTDVSTDNGWFSPSITTESSYMFDSLSSDFQSLQPGQPISQMLFLASQKRETSSRKYQTLPQLLGSLTGMAHLLMFVGYGVSNLQHKINSLKLLINSLYYVPKIKNKRKKKNSKNNLKIVKTKQSKEITKEKTNEKNEKAKNITEIFPQIKKSYSNQMDVGSQSERLSKIKEKKVSSFKNNSKDDNFETKHIKSPVNLNQFELNEPNQRPPYKNHYDSFILEHYSDRKIGEEIKNEQKTQHPQLFTETQPQITETQPPLLFTETQPQFTETQPPFTETQAQNTEKVDPKTKVNKQSGFKEKFLKFMPSKKKIEGNKLDLGLFEYIKAKLHGIFKRKLSDKEKLIQESEKIFADEIDLIKILSKIHEIEKIKLILFDSDQLLLFNGLTKPMIGSEIIKDFNLEANNKINVKMSQLIASYKSKKIEDMQKTYETVLMNSGQNEINKRLIELLDADLKLKL